MNYICRFNLAIERLIISGSGGPAWGSGRLGFNLAIERLIISGVAAKPAGQTSLCFNLAIERLIISGYLTIPKRPMPLTKFQSRNRAAYHFRWWQKERGPVVFKFQSRNRAAYHFRMPCRQIGTHWQTIVSISQSSGLSFQVVGLSSGRGSTRCFNLAIERLIISGSCNRSQPRSVLSVSISQSRCLSFQG